jgi:hypothetical protein
VRAHLKYTCFGLAGGPTRAAVTVQVVELCRLGHVTPLIHFTYGRVDNDVLHYQLVQLCCVWHKLPAAGIDA